MKIARNKAATPDTRLRKNIFVFVIDLRIIFYYRLK